MVAYGVIMPSQAVCLVLFLVIYGKCENANHSTISNVYDTHNLMQALNFSKNIFALNYPKPHLNSHFIYTGTCEHVQRLIADRGTIFNPGYPVHYDNHTSCTWKIQATSNQTITISFDDLDLKNDSETLCGRRPGGYEYYAGPCCLSNWVKITAPLSGHERKFCGEINSLKSATTFIDKTGLVIIKFHTSSLSNSSSGRGFHLTYQTSSITNVCKADEFKCLNNKCILSSWRCNRRNECGDNSDELDCELDCATHTEVKCDSGGGDISPGCYSFPHQRCNDQIDCDNGADEKGCDGCPKNMFMCSTSLCYTESKRCDGHFDCPDFKDELNCGLCGPNKTMCSTNSLTECYNPFEQRCDMVLDCSNGNDEKNCTHNCENKILCASGSGCYSPAERCNGVPTCNDYSDEKNCSLDLCRSGHGSYLCANGRCIRMAWTCDRSNDCGDSSDELNCLKSSVITAALMGSLICGLLLVVAISCTCKLIALRRAEQRQNLTEAMGHTTAPSTVQGSNYARCFPFGNVDNNGTLFAYDQDFMYREPPPSYAASVGLPEHNVDSSRQSRRPRRLRRHRRRPPTPPSDLPENDGTASENALVVQVVSTGDCSMNSEPNSTLDESRGERNRTEEENDDKEPDTEFVGATAPIRVINIELDNIPPFTQVECDQEPLLS